MTSAETEGFIGFLWDSCSDLHTRKSLSRAKVKTNDLQFDRLVRSVIDGSRAVEFYALSRPRVSFWSTSFPDNIAGIS
jgi:hypothetical protein